MMLISGASVQICEPHSDWPNQVKN